MHNMVSIKGLDKVDVLCALYDRTQPKGMGFLHYNPQPMTRAEAMDLLSKGQRFDYVRGRVMKVNLSNDEFDPWLFDRDNGDGAAESVIAALRAKASSAA